MRSTTYASAEARVVARISTPHRARETARDPHGSETPMSSTIAAATAATAAPPAAPAAYDDLVVRRFTIMTLVWGIVGMAVGALIAAQLFWPELNFGIPWLSYGRLRPLHT